MSKKYFPIVITCGDPSGVGPEVAVSAWKALRDEIATSGPTPDGSPQVITIGKYFLLI
jgi:4-hydroxy-L-threonine phosphate dehydrogenase PdxA